MVSRSDDARDLFPGPDGGLRCGIDIVSIERIARLDRELGPQSVSRIFGERELAACRVGRSPERKLAERFAAKEACLKLFPEETAACELGVEDIEVLGEGIGGFRIEPGERLRRAMERRGLSRISVSLASCRTEACAMAVAEAAGRALPGIGAELRRAADSVRALRPGLLGRAIYRFFPVRRRVVLANMCRVFGDLLDAAEYRRLAEAFYEHMGRFVAECAAYAVKAPRRIAEEILVENIEVPLEASRRGRGLIILTGHFGNWEIACAGASLQFPQYHGKFHFLRRPISTRWIESLVLRRFRRAGLQVVPKKHSLFPILELLERNEALVFIMDQHASVPKDGVVVDFFGHPAGTFRSLALIAKASGAPVIPAHGWRKRPGLHVLRFEEPVPWIPRDDPVEEVRANTLAYNRALERMVLLHPEQWFWMHKRWKIQGARARREGP